MAVCIFCLFVVSSFCKFTLNWEVLRAKCKKTSSSRKFVASRSTLSRSTLFTRFPVNSYSVYWKVWCSQIFLFLYLFLLMSIINQPWLTCKGKCICGGICLWILMWISLAMIGKDGGDIEPWFISICICCWCPIRLRCFGKDWQGRGWDRAWVDGCPALCHILSCEYATATSKMISCKMTMSVIQVNYKNYYGVLSSQHCRLT